MNNLAKLENDLWEAADQLRANGNVPYNEFFMPVMGIIFLRHAVNHFGVVDQMILSERASGQMKRATIAADYRKRRALYLPEVARYEHTLSCAKDRRGFAHSTLYARGNANPLAQPLQLRFSAQRSRRNVHRASLKLTQETTEYASRLPDTF